MDSTTARLHLYHRSSSKRPREESDDDGDIATTHSNPVLRNHQEQRTPYPPSPIRRGQPQEHSSDLGNSADPLTNRFMGPSAQATNAMTQDRSVPVNPSFQFDAYNSRLDAGGDIGSRNVSQHGHGSQFFVGDNNRTTIYYVDPPVDEHDVLLRGIRVKLGTYVASDAVLSKAIHGEPSLCYGGTRENLLEDILSWVEAGNQQEAWVAGRSKCIIGAPGAGKSTIMNTLIVKLLSDATRRSPGLISAHYCIRRSLQSTTDWTKVLATLIPQLARGSLQVARSVHSLLNHRPQTDILSQAFVEELFLEAIRTHDQTVFVIIDALDEASSPATLAATLSRVIQLSSPNLRLLLATRNESTVIHNIDRNILDSIRHTIPTEESISEVGDYIAGRIRDGLRGFFGRSPSWESWPSDSQLQSLSDSAAGLFIWGRTAVDFILSHIQKRGARQRDQMIEDIGNIGMADVNALYLFILRNYLEKDEDDSEQATLQWMKRVLGLIVVAEHPLTLKDIIGFLGATLNDFDIHHFVLLTRSILVPGTEPINGSTTPQFHKTFFDFITTRRAGKFCINVEEYQRFAAERAFAVMEKHLLFNICNLGSSLTKETSNSRHHYEEFLKHVPGGLIYASTSWCYHLEKADEGFVVSNLASIRAFLRDNLLFWLEIVSLENKFWQAESWLSELGARLGSHSVHAPSTRAMNLQLANFAVDASLLIGKFKKSIQHNIPHIYTSLLAFSPRCSIVAEHYRAKAISLVIPHPRQLPPRWDRWNHGSTYFSDNSGNSVSNTLTDIRSVSNATHNNPSSRQVDTSCYRPVRCEITSLCFSPDNDQHLAVGYMDRSIGVWDVEVGNCVMNLMSYEAHVTALSYSPHGSLLAGSGLGGTSCVWNLQTGDMILGPLYSGSLHGSLIAFSPDCTLFASNSPGGSTIEVRDVYSGEIVGCSLRDPSSRPWSTRLAYSPSTTSIAAGSPDGHVWAWKVRSGEPICWEKPHQSAIYALAFSPDGRRLGSAALDNTVQILDTYTMTYTEGPLRGHTDSINSICFSPDSCYIASGSDDRTIRIWDTRTGTCVAGPIGGHTRGINAVVFSSDGSYLATGSKDGVVRLWDVCALLHGEQSDKGKARDAPVGSRLTDQTVVDEDGWTLGPKGERLFWAPDPYNACIWRPSTVKILEREFSTMINPDLSKLITGEEWKECFPGISPQILIHAPEP